MKIGVGAHRIEEITVKEGRVVEINKPHSESIRISVTELTPIEDRIYSKEELELFEGISSLSMYPAEPSFGILFKDGTHVWIRILPEKIRALVYSGRLGHHQLSKETIIPLPQKTPVQEN